jgi:hypothetical protein
MLHTIKTVAPNAANISQLRIKYNSGLLVVKPQQAMLEPH